jgi:Right handed beta helix region/Bacterial Ig domain
MRIYLDDASVYTVGSNRLDTYVTANAGTHYAVVQAWDSTGAVSKSAETINVSGDATSVAVSSPTNGATTTSPIHFVASANSSSPIAAMRIYLDNASVYTVGSSKLDTYVTASAGTHYAVVQAWDSAGAVFKSAETINVSGGGATGVVISAPSNGATTTSPIHFVASANSSSSITAMRIYLDDASVYTVGSNKLDTYVTASAGTHYAVVQAWDSRGAVLKSSATITVKSGTTANPVAVSVSPAATALQAGKQQQFTATVTGTTNTGVTWSVGGVTGGNSTVGTITSTGLYAAPKVTSNTSEAVKATSVADTSKSASASVSISPAPTPVTVAISPTSASLNAGKQQQFTATVSGTTNTGVSWLVNGIGGGSSTLGTISTSGLYTAPVANSSSTTVTITARSTYDSTASANATATIAPSTSASGSVLYVATTGANSTSCGSSSAPCADLIYAVNNHAKPGTTVIVAPGTYSYNGISSHITLSASGTASAPIVVQCATRSACLIRTNAKLGDTQFMEIDSSYLTFDGFDIANTITSGTNTDAVILLNGNNVTVSHNVIHDWRPTCDSHGGGSINAAPNTSNIVVDGNTIYNIGWGYAACQASTSVQTDGIILESDGFSRVVNNVVYNTAGWGIQIGSHTTTSGSVVANNTVIDTANGGIDAEPDVPNLTIVNNIVLHTGLYISACGIRVTHNATSAQPSDVIDNNLVYDNAGGGLCLGSASSANNITNVNPSSGTLFVNYQTNGSGDYHLKAGSPAINAGTPNDAPNTDLDGNPRTGVPDIGAYEYPL